MTRAQTDALTAVASARVEQDQARTALRKATELFHARIVTARDAGCSARQIAGAAGVSPERVTQIAPATKAPKPRAQAQKDVPVNSCAVVPGAVPTMADHGADTGTGLSGVVTTRKRTPYGRPTLFYRDGFGVAVEQDGTYRRVWLGWPDHDNKLDHLLGLVEREWDGVKSVRVFVTGEAPFLSDGAATQAEQVREWALEMTRPEWEAESHYLADPLLPVLRFRHRVTGQAVVVLRSATWWGETDADQATSAHAWRSLEMALDRERLFAGAGLADTPATTGRALWLRTIPEDKSYPVLSDELRELIGATSGQGRVELLEPATDKAAGFTYLDGRFMYASLCGNLPVGEPTMWTGEQVEALDARGWTSAIRGRGRWRITATVPESWSHVGMLMAPDAAGGWRYPSKPGERFETWADGSEVWAAQSWGWDVSVHEGFTFSEGKPLETWVKKLLTIWKAASAHTEPAPLLAARAIRAMVLYTIGAFHQRAHPVTHTAPLDAPPDDIPPGVEVTRSGDRLTWETPGKLSAWSMETAHPEWSSTVWARARTRLLLGKGVDGANVGALYLHPSQVVGFATDALYLATDPGWADDGAPGRFRSKGSIPKAVPWPRTFSELWELRDRAEAGR